MAITVVIPAYNAERFLPRCLGSVFAQTLHPHEVIVVDDGSTDNTANIAEQLGAKVAKRANGGLSAARNTGIQKASGDWIALLDADDLWEPEKLARQVAAIHSDTVLVYTGIKFFDDRGPRGERRAVDPDSAVRMLRYRNPISPSSVLMRRDAVLKCGGFCEAAITCEDWGMWNQLTAYGQFVAVCEPLTRYYLHPKSLSASPEKMLQGLRTIMEPILLHDLRGIHRHIWKRRIWAIQLCSAGLIARDNGLKGEIRYFFSSLRAWPSPLWHPRRFQILCVSLKNSLFHEISRSRPAREMQ